MRAKRCDCPKPIPPPASVPVASTSRSQTKSASFRRKMFQSTHLRPCHWCGTDLNRKQATTDHVMPLSFGGEDDRRNMVISCRDCNATRNYISHSVLSGTRTIRDDLAEAVERWVSRYGASDPWLLKHLASLQLLGWIVSEG